MTLQEKLNNLRLQIKALAVKSELTDEQADELERLMKDAAVVERQIKALEMTAEPEAEDVDGEIDLLRAEVAELKAAVNAPPTNGGGVKLPNIKKVTDRGFADDEVKSFVHYLRTGDVAPYRANVNPLNSSDDAQGAVTVPEDWYRTIIAKRDELSIPRMAGALVIQTSTDKVHIPVEDGSSTYFVLTADETAYDEDEPTFTDKAVDVYKWTKMQKVSDELLADSAANIEAFLADGIGRAMAITENKCTLTGSGSGQPQGIFVGGTAGLTLDSATAIGAAEVPELLYKLGSPYLNEACYCMTSATYGVITGLGTATFRWYQTTPAGTPNAYNGSIGALEGKPVFVSDEAAAIGGGNKSMAVCNWRFYGLVERQGLRVRRLNELYAASGQVGFLYDFRFGGIVLQAEAFQYATHPTS